jgi:hypothetical protein
VAFANYKKYLISLMILDDVDTSDFHLIQSRVVQYYKKPFWAWGSWDSSSADVWDVNDKVTNDYILDAPFAEEEIHRVIFGMVVAKIAGPYGFFIKFYQHFLHQLKHDLLILFLDFYHDNLDISMFNRAYICLIPKYVNPSWLWLVSSISTLVPRWSF